jgi:uncharacterized membrane protein HdeD (DUF308 family)
VQEQTVTPTDTRPSPAAPARQASSSIVFGSVAAAMAIWLLPYVFGPVGVIFGVNALLHGDRRGRWVIVVAVVGLVLGLIVNVIPDHILFSGS